MSWENKCKYKDFKGTVCLKNKIGNFCKFHKYLENKVNPDNIEFCQICNCVITNNMGDESFENLKCSKCIKIIFCKGLTNKNNACTYKAKDDDEYCELHQSYKKWKELSENGIKICTNWIRGCWNNILDDNTYCKDCINKSNKNIQIQNDFIENAVKYNNSSLTNKMCLSCNFIYENDELCKNDICKKCNRNNTVNVDNYMFKDIFEKKISFYKHGAKTRNLSFTLSDKDCIILFSKKCYYCGFLNEELGIGIDRTDNSKGYIKSNCVPCCSQCNIMKRDKNLTDFVKICQHIATTHNKFEGTLDYSLFETAQTSSYLSYINGAKDRNLTFELGLKDFKKLVNDKCYYCNVQNKTNSYDGSGGIDRKNNLLGYTSKNCVSCCKTCNYLKHTQSLDEFIKRCAIISKHTSLNVNEDLEDILIEKLYDSLNCPIKRIRPNFIHSYDYYNSRIWNGNIDEIKKIKISLEFVNSKEQKDLWNYYRYYVSSLQTFTTENFIGRTICILVKDLVTRKYLGIISLSSDIKDLKDRDEYIGWSNDNKFKDSMLNRIMNLSTCVSLQPFGFNFNGGKLLTKLAFSKEVLEKFYEKYNQELLGIVTTGLYGKSVQYDRLKELKFIGMTSGSSVYKISPEITKLCRQYLLVYHNKITTKMSKLHVLSDALHKLKLPRELFITDNPKGIYFGYTYENSKSILCGKKKTLKNSLANPTNEIFDEWYNRWAVQRYNHLKNNNKLKEFDYKNLATRIKIFRQRKIELNGLDNFLENVSAENKRYYQQNKEKIIKKNLINYHKNKKITNNKYNDYIILDENTKILKPDLPKNISLFKENKYIYIQYSKKEKENKFFIKNKIGSINLQEELDKLIANVNDKYPNLSINKYTINNLNEWNNSKELHELIIPKKQVKIINNNKLIKIYENSMKVGKNLEINPDENKLNKEFRLPKNITVTKTSSNEYFLTFVKSIDSERIKKMAKLKTNDFQKNYDDFIDLINNSYKDIANLKKEILYNIPEEYTNIIKKTNIQPVDNTNVIKPTMPINFSICHTKGIDYIQFCKKIDDKKHQYKTKINSYDIESELSRFIDELNEKYDLELDPEDYPIINTGGWKTTNQIITHEDTAEKQSQRERTRKYLEKKKKELGEDQFRKQNAEKAKSYRQSKREIEV
jgi:hypothetical protein